MQIEEVKELSIKQRYLYWIKERELIRIKKELGKPKPWTDDEILQSYRFCNVRRMDDKVSQWLLKNWYEPYYNHPNMLLAVVMARHFNKPETLEYVGFPNVWRPAQVISKIRKLKKVQPVFNGAYIITGKYATSDKIEGVVNYVLDPFKKADHFCFNSVERLVSDLQQMTGIGSFMAGQIAADARWSIDGDFTDRNRWAALGPGSRRGMNRYQGREITYRLQQVEFGDELTEVIKIVKKKLPKIYSSLEAIDIQNTFCEFDKYERALWNEGRPKQRYQGV